MPNSPETNRLDLGVWVALQSKVETIHKGKVMQSDELSKSVNQAFLEIDESVLDRVHDRWKLVLDLIIAGKGTNEGVEEHRGTLNRLLLQSKDLPTIPDSVKVDGYYSLSEDEEDSDDVDVSAMDEVDRLYDRC